MTMSNPPTLNTRWLLLFFAATTALAFYELGIFAILYVVGFCVLGWLFITIGQSLNLIRMPGAEAKPNPSSALKKGQRVFAALIGVATGAAAALTLFYYPLSTSSAQGMVLMAGWPCALFSLLCLRKAFTDPARFMTTSWITSSGILGILVAGWRIFLAYRLPSTYPSGNPNKYFYEGILEGALILLAVMVFNVQWKRLLALLLRPKDMGRN